ncbi:hypothetical protein AWZ03_015420, partial [Drosophila navojoa]
MVATKAKNSGNVKQKKPKSDSDIPALKSKGWQKVKIKGHVISDDFTGYEGMIGLEVLKEYDPALVKSTQKQSNDSGYEQNKRRKRSKSGQDSEESSSEEEDSDDDAQSGAASKKKAKLAERHALRLQKQREKREKRKQERKQKKAAPTTTEAKSTKSQFTPNEDYAPDRFALLRPPPPSDDEQL